MVKKLTTSEFKNTQPARYALIVRGLFDNVDDVTLYGLYCAYFKEYCAHVSFADKQHLQDPFTLLYFLENSVTALFDYDSELWACYSCVEDFQYDRSRIINMRSKYYTNVMMADIG